MSSPDAPDLNAITQTINIARHTAFMNPGMLWAREMERVCGGALDVIAALREAEAKLAAADSAYHAQQASIRIMEALLEAAQSERDTARATVSGMTEGIGG